MEPSDIISEELEQIYTMLDILEVMHDRLQNNLPINLNDLKKIIRYFKVFVHKSHNKKEEDIVFPELKRCNSVASKDMVKELLSENSLGELYLKTLKEMINNYEKGDIGTKDEIMDTMRKYLKLEKNHVQKEELFILPLCKREISQRKNQEMLKAMIDHDNHDFGEGMHGKFHKAFSKVISSMQKEYFNSN